MAEVQGGLRVAYDDTGGVWDELAGRKGYFTFRGSGLKSEDELNLWQIADRYGIDRVVTRLEVWLLAEARWVVEQRDENPDRRVAYLEARVGELQQTIGDLRAESENRLQVGDRLGWQLVEAREEIARLQRQLEFEMYGGDNFSAADALAEDAVAGPLKCTCPSPLVSSASDCPSHGHDAMRTYFVSGWDFRCETCRARGHRHPQSGCHLQGCPCAKRPVEGGDPTP
jgi:hypothetical protein